MWEQIKSEVARSNTKFNITSVKHLLLTAIGNVTPQQWTNVVKHTLKVEDAFWKADFANEADTPEVEPVIIEFCVDTSDSDSDFQLSDQTDTE